MEDRARTPCKHFPHAGEVYVRIYGGEGYVPALLTDSAVAFFKENPNHIPTLEISTKEDPVKIHLVANNIDEYADPHFQHIPAIKVFREKVSWIHSY
jgi:hypothetical protein